MHKVFYLIIFTCVFQVNLANAQGKFTFDYNVHTSYKFVNQPDSTDEKSKTTEFLNLLINKDYESISLTLKKYQSDSAFYVLREKYGSNYMDFSLGAQYYSKHQFVIKKNADKITTIDIGDAQLYRYTELKSSLLWDIENNTKKIAGFNCQKATVNFGGRQWIAWFTTDIPISDGPYKFCGLPGLIVDIADTQDYFHFTLASFVMREGVYKVDNQSNISEINKNNFLKLVDDYRINKFEMDQASNRIRFTSEVEEAKKNIIAYAQKNNNPIEFYLK